MKKWFQKLTDGLSKTSQQLSGSIKEIFTHQKLTAENLENLEDILIQADLGPVVSHRIVEKISSHRFEKDTGFPDAMSVIVHEIQTILKPYERTIAIPSMTTPFGIAMVGVNGTGKTTTTAKMAHLFQQQGYTLSIAACDTFRAGAVEQLKEWGNRLDVPVFSRPTGNDPAGVAYDAYQNALQKKDDIIFFDTAGRLHTQQNLMAELSKVVRVLKKIDTALPHETILVLDGTTGQNAHRQVEIFQQTLALTGLVITKLDGTAKGGILVSLADRFKLPIYAIGVGETMDDLNLFKSDEFAAALAKF